MKIHTNRSKMKSHCHSEYYEIDHRMNEIESAKKQFNVSNNQITGFKLKTQAKINCWNFHIELCMLKNPIKQLSFVIQLCAL